MPPATRSACKAAVCCAWRPSATRCGCAPNAPGPNRWHRSRPSPAARIRAWLPLPPRRKMPVCCVLHHQLHHCHQRSRRPKSGHPSKWTVSRPPGHSPGRCSSSTPGPPMANLRCWHRRGRRRHHRGSHHLVHRPRDLEGPPPLAAPLAQDMTPVGPVVPGHPPLGRMGSRRRRRQHARCLACKLALVPTSSGRHTKRQL
mmetsp:Transcript_72977/g.189510  ORF Transcript_72977/g.189510 Transcript_72977/m.189510 type:complete len:200 (+) Transcript_72977:250-849(+)